MKCHIPLVLTKHWCICFTEAAESFGTKKSAEETIAKWLRRAKERDLLKKNFK